MKVIVIVLFPQEHCIDNIPPQHYYVLCFTGTKTILNYTDVVVENKRFWLNRTDPMESVTDMTAYVPWWLDCNRARYPYWYGQREPRLQQLYEALQFPHLYSMDSHLFLSL